MDEADKMLAPCFSYGENVSHAIQSGRQLYMMTDAAFLASSCFQTSRSR